MSAGPDRACPRCPRLVAYRARNADEIAGGFNGAVPSFGPIEAPLLIVGLAPGRMGANRTGRPFTGDDAGELLYPTILEFGLGKGPYGASLNDGMTLTRCRITNAVRCAPPENKPTPAEIAACRPFLIDEIAAMPRLRAILALGRIAHDSVLRAKAIRLAEMPFTHGARHELGAGLTLYDSFHCSRYNTNTRKLTPAMFRSVFKAITDDLDSSR
ncbi:MAG: uracil-DNA glycosylase [Alphaproteobacteria bacterium]|nr:uracil-DNA glycosylase [Alphaproteobacteria bacterium]